MRQLSADRPEISVHVTRPIKGVGVNAILIPHTCTPMVIANYLKGKKEKDYFDKVFSLLF